MSKIIDKLNEENAIRVSGNMINTLRALETQMASDAVIITEKEALIASASDGSNVSTADLIALADARTRTIHNNTRKAEYKLEFPKQKEKISDADMKAEIDAEVAKL